MKDILITIAVIGYCYCLLVLMKYYYHLYILKRNKDEVIDELNKRGIFF